MKNLLYLLLLFIIACNNVTGNDEPDFSIGPDEEEYDYYIALSYSDDQSQLEGYNHFYVLITSNDDSIETLELLINDVEIELEYANYGGQDFYIQYFDQTIGELINYEIKINGETTEAELTSLSVLNMELQPEITEGEEVELSWQIENDPHVIYVEGFQRDSQFEALHLEQRNLSASDRSFTMPADWLWSETDVAFRDIQLGIMNFTVKNRIAFTFSDDSYRSYSN